MLSVYYVHVKGSDPSGLTSRPQQTKASWKCEVVSYRARSFKTVLKWPNTVFAPAFGDAIRRVHKGFQKQTCCQKNDHSIYSSSTLSAVIFLYN